MVLASMSRKSASTRGNPDAARARESQAPSHTEEEALRQRKYRKVLRRYLGRLLEDLFAEFTGLHFHIAWKPVLPMPWEGRSLPTGGSVCCRLRGSPLQPDCRTCGSRQLTRALRSAGNGHHFICRRGVRNYWIPIRVRGETLGIAYQQALERSKARREVRAHAAGVLTHRLRQAEARVLSQSNFARAARLLRYLVQHVQTASLADLRKADLTSAGHALLALETEVARLHKTLQRHLPSTVPVSRRAGPGSHAEEVVRRLLKRVGQEYRKPIQLQEYARDLGLNAAYLSDLFSRAVGVPFKAYLVELRLEKARELLGDPANTVSEVAYAVGYTSEARFRMAFKKATGLSPRLWRETMQTQPLTPRGA